MFKPRPTCGAELATRIEVPVHVADTLMKTLGDREHVARAALAFAAEPGARLR